MYTWHGWVQVRASAEATDDVDGDAEQTEAQARVAALLSAVPHEPAFEVWDCRVQNGICAVWLAGCRNHRQDRVIEDFRAIGDAAPGWFGLLYVHDDEAAPDTSWFADLDPQQRTADPRDQWQRWVMTRGSVHIEADRSLSPVIDLLEDRPAYER